MWIQTGIAEILSQILFWYYVFKNFLTANIMKKMGMTLDQNKYHKQNIY